MEDDIKTEEFIKEVEELADSIAKVIDAHNLLSKQNFNAVTAFALAKVAALHTLWGAYNEKDGLSVFISVIIDYQQRLKQALKQDNKGEEDDR